MKNPESAAVTKRFQVEFPHNHSNTQEPHLPLIANLIHDARSIFHQVLNSTSAEIRNVSVFTFQEIKGCGAT